MIEFQNKLVFWLKRVKDDAYSGIITPFLVDGEQILSTYQTMRDGVVFTNKRIISINVQGVTGKKKDFTSMPYSKIQVFSVETAGLIDDDTELELYFAGVGKVKFEFTVDANVAEICKIISNFVLWFLYKKSPPKRGKGVHMLTCKEISFINKLVKYAKRNNNCFEFSVPKNSVDNFLKEINFKISHNELALMLESLNAKGYFYEYTPHNNRTDADMFSGVFFCLTHDELHHTEIEIKKLIEYILKSVVVPIIMSIITTLITMEIKSL